MVTDDILKICKFVATGTKSVLLKEQIMTEIQLATHIRTYWVHDSIRTTGKRMNSLQLLSSVNFLVDSCIHGTIVIMGC